MCGGVEGAGGGGGGGAAQALQLSRAAKKPEAGGGVQAQSRALPSEAPDQTSVMLAEFAKYIQGTKIT